jgi:hypothetical protein
MAMATTVDALIERCRRDALLASRGAVYTLSQPYTAGGATLTLNETPTHIGTGAIISIDYELFYVLSVQPGSKQCSVIPAYFGSTNANHALNSIVEIDARFPKAALIDYAEQEIRSWGKTLWRVTSQDLTVDRTGRAYDLPITGEIYFVLDVRVKPPGGSSSNPYDFSWTGDGWPHAAVRLLRGMSTAEFPSGTAIQFLRSNPRDSTARVTVAQPLDLSAFTSATDLVGDVGCKTEWLDIIELGVRYRAMSSTVVGRADWRTGNMSRNAEEVSTFDVMRATQQAQGLRDLRLAHEANQLRAEWPYTV